MIVERTRWQVYLMLFGSGGVESAEFIVGSPSLPHGPVFVLDRGTHFTTLSGSITAVLGGARAYTIYQMVGCLRPASVPAHARERVHAELAANQPNPFSNPFAPNPPLLQTCSSSS